MKRKITVIAWAILSFWFISLTPAPAAEINYTYYSRWSNTFPASPDFFPIGMWHQGSGRAADYAAAGINLNIAPRSFSDAELALFRSVGMYVIVEQSSSYLSRANADVIVGWLQPDEPDLDQNGSPCIDPAVIQGNYNRWTSADPTRPVYIGLSQAVAYTQYGGRGACTNRTDMYPEYCKGADICSFDIYPVANDDPIVQGNLWYVPKGIDSLRMWSNYEKPVWCTVEGTHINGELMATPPELKAQIWMALIHEAKGYLYFCHEWYPSFTETAWLDRYPAMKTAITDINQEVTSLAPVLYSPTVKDVVDVTVNWRSPIDCLVKVHNGSTYLFAVVMRKRGDTAAFTFSGLPAAATAQVIGEDRTIPVVDGQFSDAFDPWGVHLYKIDTPLDINPGPVQMVRKLKRATKVYANPGNRMVLDIGRDLADRPVRTAIFNSQGQLVWTLALVGGTTAVQWDGQDLTGHLSPAGLYQVRLTCDQASVTKSFILIH